jgi:hypothetical protein
MRSPAGVSRITVQRVLQSAALVAAVAALATGCGSGTVQREAPGLSRSTTSTSADGTDWSMQARNVDLSITDAVIQLGASGTARLDFTVDNKGPVTEHLAVVTVPPQGQATLQGSAGPVNALSTAGIMIDSGDVVSFGAGAPSVQLPSAKGLTAGSTTPVLLDFGIAGAVHLTVPVRAA